MSQTNLDHSLIPMYDELKGMRIKDKHCLDHGKVLSELSYISTEANFPCPYVLVMGWIVLRESGIPLQHCWLETLADNPCPVAIDLIEPKRFFRREDYYCQVGVQEETVHRYTKTDVNKRIIEDGYLEFWDLSKNYFAGDADLQASYLDVQKLWSEEVRSRK